MRIKEITFESRNDFHAIMVCEHCGHTQNLTSGYHDNYYHTQVIPSMHCKGCGRNSAGLIGPAGFVAKPKPTVDELAKDARAEAYKLTSVYSCNGSKTGCERERFGHCTYHDNIDTWQHHN